MFKVSREDLVVSYSLQVAFCAPWFNSQGCHSLTRADFNSFLICLGIRRKSINFQFKLTDLNLETHTLSLLVGDSGSLEGDHQ